MPSFEQTFDRDESLHLFIIDRHPRVCTRAVLGVAAAGALVAIVGWETIWQRFEEPNPYTLRADLVRSSLEMAGDRPLLGFGLGAGSSAYPRYARFDDGLFVNQAHNDWVQGADEGGLPFLLAMIAAAALLACSAVRSLWGLGLMAVFLHAFVDYPFQQRPALAAFFLRDGWRAAACGKLRFLAVAVLKQLLNRARYKRRELTLTTGYSHFFTRRKLPSRTFPGFISV